MRLNLTFGSSRLFFYVDMFLREQIQSRCHHFRSELVQKRGLSIKLRAPMFIFIQQPMALTFKIASTFATCCLANDARPRPPPICRALLRRRRRTPGPPPRWHSAMAASAALSREAESDKRWTVMASATAATIMPICIVRLWFCIFII